MTDHRRVDIERTIRALVSRQERLEEQGKFDESRLIQHDIEELEVELLELDDEYQMTLDFDDEA